MSHRISKARSLGVDGLVDLYVETQVDIPQLRVQMDREAMAMYGVQVEDLAHDLETAFNQHAVVGQVLEGQFPYDLTVRFSETARQQRRMPLGSIVRHARWASGSLTRTYPH